MATRLPLEQKFGVRVPGPQFGCSCDRIATAQYADSSPARDACTRPASIAVPCYLELRHVGQVRIPPACGGLRRGGARRRPAAAASDSAPVVTVQGASGASGAGGAAALSKSEFIEQANSICSEANAAISSLDSGTVSTSSKLQATQELQITQQPARLARVADPARPEPLDAEELPLGAAATRSRALTSKRDRRRAGRRHLHRGGRGAQRPLQRRRPPPSAYGLKACAKGSQAGVHRRAGPAPRHDAPPRPRPTPTTTTPVPTTPAARRGAPGPGGTGGAAGGGTGGGDRRRTRRRNERRRLRRRAAASCGREPVSRHRRCRPAYAACSAQAPYSREYGAARPRSAPRACRPRRSGRAPGRRSAPPV